MDIREQAAVYKREKGQTLWHSFDTWWHDAHEKLKRRPRDQEVDEWYRSHATRVWGVGRPSLEATRDRARRLQAEEEERAGTVRQADLGMAVATHPADAHPTRAAARQGGAPGAEASVSPRQAGAGAVQPPEPCIGERSRGDRAEHRPRDGGGRADGGRADGGRADGGADGGADRGDAASAPGHRAPHNRRASPGRTAAVPSPPRPDETPGPHPRPRSEEHQRAGWPPHGPGERAAADRGGGAEGGATAAAGRGAPAPAPGAPAARAGVGPEPGSHAKTRMTEWLASLASTALSRDAHAAGASADREPPGSGPGSRPGRSYGEAGTSSAARAAAVGARGGGSSGPQGLAHVKHEPGAGESGGGAAAGRAAALRDGAAAAGGGAPGADGGGGGAEGAKAQRVPQGSDGGLAAKHAGPTAAAAAGVKRPAGSDPPPAPPPATTSGALPAGSTLSGRAPKLLRLDQVLAAGAVQRLREGASGAGPAAAPSGGGTGAFARIPSFGRSVSSGRGASFGDGVAVAGEGATRAAGGAGDAVGGRSPAPAAPIAAGDSPAPPRPPPEPFRRPPYMHMPSLDSERGSCRPPDEDGDPLGLLAKPSGMPPPRAGSRESVGTRVPPPARDSVDSRAPTASVQLRESVGTHNLGAAAPQQPGRPALPWPAAMRHRESLESHLMPPPPPPLLLPEGASVAQSTPRLLAGARPRDPPPPPLAAQLTRPAAATEAANGAAELVRAGAAGESPPQSAASGDRRQASGGAAAAHAPGPGPASAGQRAAAPPPPPPPPAALVGMLPADAQVTAAQLPIIVQPPDVQPALLSQVVGGRLVEARVQVVTLHLTLPPEVVDMLLHGGVAP